MKRGGGGRKKERERGWEGEAGRKKVGKLPCEMNESRLLRIGETLDFLKLFLFILCMCFEYIHICAP